MNGNTTGTLSLGCFCAEQRKHQPPVRSPCCSPEHNRAVGTWPASWAGGITPHARSCCPWPGGLQDPACYCTLSVLSIDAGCKWKGLEICPTSMDRTPTEHQWGLRNKHLASDLGLTGSLTCCMFHDAIHGLFSVVRCHFGAICCLCSSHFESEANILPLFLNTCSHPEAVHSRS